MSPYSSWFSGQSLLVSKTPWPRSSRQARLLGEAMALERIGLVLSGELRLHEAQQLVPPLLVGRGVRYGLVK